MIVTIPALPGMRPKMHSTQSMSRWDSPHCSIKYPVSTNSGTANSTKESMPKNSLCASSTRLLPEAIKYAVEESEILNAIGTPKIIRKNITPKINAPIFTPPFRQKYALKCYK